MPGEAVRMVQLQSKAERKAKRLGWGARLEAAAQAGAGTEVRTITRATMKVLLTCSNRHLLDCQRQYS